jgi:hypothetical protein
MKSIKPLVMLSLVVASVAVMIGATVTQTLAYDDYYRGHRDGYYHGRGHGYGYNYGHGRGPYYPPRHGGYYNRGNYPPPPPVVLLPPPTGPGFNSPGYRMR